MPIEKSFQVTTYLLVSIGFLSLILTGELAPPYVILIIATVCVTFGNYRRKNPIVLPVWLLNFITLIFFLYETSMVFFSPRELILNVMEFLIVLQLVRLWSKKSDRDMMQIYGLSLLHLMSASVLTADFSFSIIFISYILSGTWALVVFNLRKELKLLNLPLSRFDSIITKKFFLVLSGVALAVFLFSIIIFTFFPRLNYGYLGTMVSNKSLKTGVSDRVRLGQIGEIKLDRSPIMRVTLSGPMAEKLTPNEFYLRGFSLSHYDGRQWRANPYEKKVMASSFNFRYVSVAKEYRSEANLLQEIVLEPSGTEVLFGLSKIIGIKVPFDLLSHVRGQNLASPYAGSKRFKYQVYSKVEVPAMTQLQSVSLQEYSGYDFFDDFYTYLETPDSLDERIPSLAKKLTENDKNAFDRVQTLSTFLKTKLGYTLTMDDPGDKDPLAFFLFDKKAGHCEYFASSLAMMLRTLDIPSRLVNGYHHGEWNDVGGYYLVRKSHAHAWVEAFFPGHGWVAFDPTPADPVFSAPTSFLDQWKQAFDNIQLLWVNWVVDYNFKQQRKSITSLSKKSRLVKRKTRFKWFQIKKNIKDSFQQTSKTLFSIIFVLIGFLFLAFLASKIFAKRNQKTKVRILFYEKMLKILGKKGFYRQIEQTPFEFCHLVQEKLTPGEAPEAVEDLTSLFCRVRYGSHELNKKIQAQANKHLKTLQTALRD